MPDLLPAPLPRRPVPLDGETAENYLRRLARANYQDRRRLTGYLSGNPNGGAPNLVLPETLAAATALPLSVIGRLHGLRYQRLGPYPNAGVRPACRRCAARRGILGPVPCRMPPDMVVCRRHQLWIGRAARTINQQLDVAEFPEVLQAQRRHHQLLHHWQWSTVDFARSRAEHVIHTAIDRGQWTDGQRQRLIGLDPHLWARVNPEAPASCRENYLLQRPIAVEIATYPDLIRLISRDLRARDQAWRERQDHLRAKIIAFGGDPAAADELTDPTRRTPTPPRRRRAGQHPRPTTGTAASAP